MSEDLKKETIGLQWQQTALEFQQNRIIELLVHNQKRNKFLQPCVPVCDGNPILSTTLLFCAFENLVESGTYRNTYRLCCLEQFTTGHMKELVRSCRHLSAEEGCDEAHRLLRRKYGDDYCIASTLDWLSIKAEDGVALNCFSVFLTSCKNALAGSQYIF